MFDPARKRINSSGLEGSGPLSVRKNSLTIPAAKITTSTTTTSLPAMQIEYKRRPSAAASEYLPRKAPSPPTPNRSVSLRSSRTTSQDTLRQDEKEILKEFDTFELEDNPPEPTTESPFDPTVTSTFEVDALRSKVELLELKLEEMTTKVHVCIPS
jgi:hypothetical protein